MSPNPGFQVSVDVKGRVCVVLGGGEEAAEKAQRLLDAGAKVTVIHPTLNDTLRKLAASAKIIHRGRMFRAADTEGVIVIINTLRDADLSRSLLELAKKERFLVCSVDQPEFSTVNMPAVVSRGYLRIAVSTSGVAPALASRLRQDLEEIFGAECEAFLTWLSALREEAKNEADAQQRRHRLRDAVEGFKLRGQLEFPQVWTEQRQA
jgi:precorrin-2 dehydrogenase/sirohydrochlorin ferrochelatase